MANNLVTLYEKSKIENNKISNLIQNIRPGNVVQVTLTNQKTTTKRVQFIGICIEIRNKNVNTSLLLRNYISGEAVEQRIYCYAPNIYDIQIIKQNKPQPKYRRNKLYYLRNRTPKESTVTI